MQLPCPFGEASSAFFVMTFGFVLALYCKNIFVILTGPFMYSILENFDSGDSPLGETAAGRSF